MIINGLMGGYFLSVKGIIVENYFSIRDTIWHLDKKRELKIFLSGLQTMLPVWTTLILIESEFYFTTNGRSTSAERDIRRKILLLSSDKIRWHLDEKLGLALEEPDEYTELIGFSVPSDVIMTKEKEQ